MRGRECGTWTLGGVGGGDGARSSAGRRPHGRFASVQSKCCSGWELSVLILEVGDGQGVSHNVLPAVRVRDKSLLSPVRCPVLTSQKQEGDCPPK